MHIVKVEAHPDHLKIISKVSPVEALAELIWNGFDAKANNVYVNFKRNTLDIIEEISVKDDGNGIDRNEIDKLFGSLGGSWKKEAKRKEENNYLHGENGQGRFKAFSLGEKIQWDTVLITGPKEGLRRYTISADVNDMLGFKVSDSYESIDRSTVVTIYNICKEASCSFKDIDNKIAERFVLYLCKYKDKKLFVNDKIITSDLVQENVTNKNLGDCKINDDLIIQLKLHIVEWKKNIKTSQQISYCDGNGFTLYEEKINKKIPAICQKFTVFAESEYFKLCYDEKILSAIDLSVELIAIKEIILEHIKSHFIEKEKKERSEIVTNWINDDIYPYNKTDILNPVLEAEKKMFDILAVNVQTYLKKFDKSDKKTRKFTFKLLKQAIEANPEAVQEIINEVLDLTKDEQDSLANLLKRTTLSSIISTSKMVTGRLDFIQALEQLLFDSSSKKLLLERDQLHKVLENEAWIFKEDFYLTGSEESLNEVLKKHLDLLGKRYDDDSTVLRHDGSKGRVDLMLSKSRQPTEGKLEHLVVELKRPSQKIDMSVITQIKSYAYAVISDERFDKANTYWTFMAISNELDKFALEEVAQENRPRGLIYQGKNVAVWIYTWGEILHMAKSRLRFFQKQLGYEASRRSATSYLEETHAKFIPKL